MTFRLRTEHHETLRRAAFEARGQQQALLDEALDSGAWSSGATMAARLLGWPQRKPWKGSCMAQQVVNLGKLLEAQEALDAAMEATTLAAERLAEAVRISTDPAER